MIAFTRAQARLLRVTLRKAVPIGGARNHRPPLVFQSDSDGLRIRFDIGEIAGQWHLPGPRSSETIVLPGKALDDFEGSPTTDVTLVMPAKDIVQASWQHGGVTQTRDYKTSGENALSPFPAEPKRFTSVNATFLRALDDAAQTTAREGAIRSTMRTQLRGKSGEIASTNNHQLLLQQGFPFPWKDDVLIPTIGVFGNKELATTAVSIGRTDTHVCLNAGAWKFFFRIDQAGSFPRIENAIPAQFAQGAGFQLSPEDAEFLLKELPRLPGGANDCHDITVELNGCVLVRGRDHKQAAVTELLLNRSRSLGPALTLVSDRSFLIRALHLGFTEFYIPRRDGAIVARDKNRLFVWMALHPDDVIPVSSIATRIESAPGAQPVKQTIPLAAVNKPEATPQFRRITNMPAPSTNGHPTNGDRAERGPSIAELIAETEELRNVLLDASSRLAHVLAGLKQQRRQSRAMQAAMHSLKQLQLDS